MLTLEQCKDCLGGLNLNDQEIEQLRDDLIYISEKVIDNYLENDLSERN